MILCHITQKFSQKYYCGKYEMVAGIKRNQKGGLRDKEVKQLQSTQLRWLMLIIRQTLTSFKYPWLFTGYK